MSDADIARQEPRWSAFEALLRRVRRRLILQRALERATRGLVLAGLPSLVALFAWRLALGQRLAITAVAVAATGALAGLLAGLLGRMPLERAARTLDSSHGLADRALVALEFARAGLGLAPGGFRAAAIGDALGKASRADARRAAPFRRPPSLRAALLLAVAASLVPLVRPGELPAATAAPGKVGVAVAEEELLLGRAVAEDLAKDADDDELRELAASLTRLYDDLDARKLPEDDLLARISALEKRWLDGQAGELREAREALRAAGEALERERITEEAGKALREDDLAKAKAEAERLAAEVARMPEPRQRSLRRAMQAAAKAAERRLQRKERELEKLSREKREPEPARRQLERLQRDLERAAASEMSQELADALRDLASDTGAMESEIRQLEATERVRVAIADLKEAIRRARKGGKGGKDGKDGKSEDQQAGSGKDGKGKGGGKLGEFLARGKGAEGGRTLTLGGGGDTSLMLPRPGAGRGADGDAPPSVAPGEGIGDAHDPRMGDATRIGAEHRSLRLDGQDSVGPTRSEVILSASQQGFATRGYRRVFRDYQALVEEVLHAEEVAPGQRQQVKRYFELIRPRE